jgi:hypothetical protein
MSNPIPPFSAPFIFIAILFAGTARLLASGVGGTGSDAHLLLDSSPRSYNLKGNDHV